MEVSLEAQLFDESHKELESYLSLLIDRFLKECGQAYRHVPCLLYIPLWAERAITSFYRRKYNYPALTLESQLREVIPELEVVENWHDSMVIMPKWNSCSPPTMRIGMSMTGLLTSHLIIEAL